MLEYEILPFVFVAELTSYLDRVAPLSKGKNLSKT